MEGHACALAHSIILVQACCLTGTMQAGVEAGLNGVSHPLTLHDLPLLRAAAQRSGCNQAAGGHWAHTRAAHLRQHLGEVLQCRSGQCLDAVYCVPSYLPEIAHTLCYKGLI